jgi:ABC-type multidrug transport system ATPase subunit
VADRLLIIDQGRIIAQRTLAELKKDKSAENTFVVSIRAPRQEIESALKGISGLKNFHLIEEISGTSKFLCTAFSYEEAARAINNLIREKGWFLAELALKEPSLEEVFLGLFKKAA